MGYFLIIIAIILLDQISKKIIESKFKIGKRTTIIKNMLYIEHIKNKGAAMGILKNRPLYLLFMVISSLGNIGIIFLKIIRRPKNQVYKTALAFILGGGLGNIFDRIFKKEVTDFISLKYKNFPVFNIADVFVLLGCITFFIKALGDDGYE